MLARLPLWLWMLIVFGGVMAVGIMTLFRRRAALKDNMAFATEFRQRFIDYAGSKGADRDSYHWMTMNSNKMQRHMGHAGVLTTFYDPPFSYTNYLVILNMLPRIRREFDDRWGSGGNIGPLVQMFDETLLRYLGDLVRTLDRSVADCRNPMNWFSTGIAHTLAVPLYFFSYFGVLSTASINTLQNTISFRLFAALISLLGLVASIISIINEGKPTLDYLRAMIGI